MSRVWCFVITIFSLLPGVNAQETPPISIVVDGISEVVADSNSTATYEVQGRSGIDTFGKTFTCNLGEFMGFSSTELADEQATTMSVLFWIKIHSRALEETSLLTIAHGGSDTTCQDITLSVQYPSHLVVRRCGSDVLGSPVSIDLDTWMHLSVIVSETALAIWVNAELYSRIEHAVGTVFLKKLTFCTSALYEPLQASIEAVRYFNKDLSNNDISMEFNNWCTNTCPYSNDGECDDYGVLLQNYYVCDYGTDCDDCGVRPFKRDCYDYTCTTRGRRLSTNATGVRCPETGCTDRLCCEAILDDCVGQDPYLCDAYFESECFWNTIGLWGTQYAVYQVCRDMCGLCADKHTCPVATIEGAIPSQNCSGKQVIEVGQSCEWEPMPGYSCLNLQTSYCTGYDEELSSVPQCHKSWCEFPKSPELGVTLGHCHKKVSGDSCTPTCGEGYIIDSSHPQTPIVMTCTDGPESESFSGSYFGPGNGASYIGMCAIEMQNCYLLSRTQSVTGLVMSLTGAAASKEIVIPCGTHPDDVIWASGLDDHDTAAIPCATSFNILLRDMADGQRLGWIPSEWLLTALKDPSLQPYRSQKCPSDWFSGESIPVGLAPSFFVELPRSYLITSIRVSGEVGQHISVKTGSFNASLGYNEETAVSSQLPSRHLIFDFPECSDCTMSGLYIKGWPATVNLTSETEPALVDNSVKSDADGCFEGSKATVTSGTPSVIMGYEVALCDLNNYDLDGSPQLIPLGWTLYADDIPIHNITMSIADWLSTAQYSKFIRLNETVNAATLEIVFDEHVRVGEFFAYTTIDAELATNLTGHNFYFTQAWTDEDLINTQWVTPHYIVSDNILRNSETWNVLAEQVASVVECGFLGDSVPAALVVFMNETVGIIPSSGTAVLLPSIGILAQCSDLNADGLLDIVVASNSHLSVLYATVTTHLPMYSFSDMSQLYFVMNEVGSIYDLNTSVSSILAADYDTDGWVDLFITSFSGENIMFKGSRGGLERQYVELGSKAISSTACDLDNNGKIDIITVSTGVTATVYLNGHSTWDAINVSYKHDGGSITCFDFTSDGHDDLYVSGVGATDFLLINRLAYFTHPYSSEDDLFHYSRNGPTDLSVSATVRSDQLYVAKKGSPFTGYQIQRHGDAASIAVSVKVLFRSQIIGVGMTVSIMKNDVEIKSSVIATTGRGTQSEYVSRISLPEAATASEGVWAAVVHHGNSIKTQSFTLGDSVVIELAASCSTFPLQYCPFLSLRDNADDDLRCFGSECKESDKSTCCTSNPRCDFLWDEIDGCESKLSNVNESEWCSSQEGLNCKQSCCQRGLTHDVCADLEHVNCEAAKCSDEKYSTLCPVTCSVCLPEPIMPRGYIQIPTTVVMTNTYISSSSEAVFPSGFVASSDGEITLSVSTYSNAPVAAFSFLSQTAELNPSSVQVVCTSPESRVIISGSYSSTKPLFVSNPKRCSEYEIKITGSNEIAVRQVKLFVQDPGMTCSDTNGWSSGSTTCSEYAEEYCSDEVNTNTEDEMSVNFPSDNCCGCGRTVLRDAPSCSKIVGEWSAESSDVLFTENIADAGACCKECQEHPLCRYWHHTSTTSSDDSENTCVGFKNSNTVTLIESTPSLDATHVAGDTQPIVSIPRTCSDLLLDNRYLQDGIYTVYPKGLNHEEGIPVYCDMANGGWQLFFDYEHGDSDLKLNIQPEGVSPQLHSNSHVSLNGIGYSTDDIEAIRFFCNTTQHDRIIDFSTSSTAIIQLAAGDWHTGSEWETSAGDWRQTQKLRDHSGILPDGAIGGHDMTKPLQSSEESIFMGAYEGKGWLCDGPLDGGISHPTRHLLWFKGITHFTTKYEKPSWATTVINEHCSGLAVDVTLHAVGEQHTAMLPLRPLSDTDWLCYIIRPETTSIEVVYDSDCEATSESEITMFTDAFLQGDQRQLSCTSDPLVLSTVNSKQQIDVVIIKRGSKSEGDITVYSPAVISESPGECTPQHPTQSITLRTSPVDASESECFSLTCEQGHHILIDWAPAALFWDAQIANIEIWVQRGNTWYKQGDYGRGATGFSVLDFRPQLFEVSSMRVTVTGGVPYFNLLGSGGWNCTDVRTRPCTEQDIHSCDKGPGGLCAIRNEDVICGCKKWYKDMGYACHSTCALHPGCGDGFTPKPNAAQIECGGWSCVDVQCCDQIVSPSPATAEPTAIPTTTIPTVIPSPVPTTEIPVEGTEIPSISPLSTPLPAVNESLSPLPSTDEPVSATSIPNTFAPTQQPTAIPINVNVSTDTPVVVVVGSDAPSLAPSPSPSSVLVPTVVPSPGSNTSSASPNVVTNEPVVVVVNDTLSPSLVTDSPSPVTTIDTSQPTTAPATAVPTGVPVIETGPPTHPPTTTPTEVNKSTEAPVVVETIAPLPGPTNTPTGVDTASPSDSPTAFPTSTPTAHPPPSTEMFLLFVMGGDYEVILVSAVRSFLEGLELAHPQQLTIEIMRKCIYNTELSNLPFYREHSTNSEKCVSSKLAPGLDGGRKATTLQSEQPEQRIIIELRITSEDNIDFRVMRGVLKEQSFQTSINKQLALQGVSVCALGNCVAPQTGGGDGPDNVKLLVIIIIVSGVVLLATFLIIRYKCKGRGPVRRSDSVRHLHRFDSSANDMVADTTTNEMIMVPPAAAPSAPTEISDACISQISLSIEEGLTPPDLPMTQE
eukprot:TRINITY_DN15985_c0_g1_i1.p1 TRINITY_DN15985_c0_g1~~TRINITY_DN15985_c0_g1_i1.p1  ORF type:complete len:2689 (+),score=497.36 TRINITY_DN15985_c0_g1_i1:61-8067(+)